jgi:hypothetical protein
MSDQQVSDKFSVLAHEVLPRDQDEQALAALWKIDAMGNVRDLVQLLVSGD